MSKGVKTSIEGRFPKENRNQTKKSETVGIFPMKGAMGGGPIPLPSFYFSLTATKWPKKKQVNQPQISTLRTRRGGPLTWEKFPHFPLFRLESVPKVLVILRHFLRTFLTCARSPFFLLFFCSLAHCLMQTQTQRTQTSTSIFTREVMGHFP